MVRQDRREGKRCQNPSRELNGAYLGQNWGWVCLYLRPVGFNNLSVRQLWPVAPRSGDSPEVGVIRKGVTRGVLGKDGLALWI